jgi:hypothetical protein
MTPTKESIHKWRQWAARANIARPEIELTAVAFAQSDTSLRALSRMARHLIAEQFGTLLSLGSKLVTSNLNHITRRGAVLAAPTQIGC